VTEPKPAKLTPRSRAHIVLAAALGLLAPAVGRAQTIEVVTPLKFGRVMASDSGSLDLEPVTNQRVAHLGVGLLTDISVESSIVIVTGKPNAHIQILLPADIALNKPGSGVLHPNLPGGSFRQLDAEGKLMLSIGGTLDLKKPVENGEITVIVPISVDYTP